MTRDLLALALANGCLLAAGHGVLRLAGFRPAVRDLAWSLGLAYLAGAAAVGVLGSALLVLGLPLSVWQLVVLCVLLLGAGALRQPVHPPVRPDAGLPVRALQLATALVLAVLAVDLLVQPIWTEDAWSIWAPKATAIVLLDGLDPDVLASASLVSPSYPLVVPVLELVALRFSGLPNELIPLQLGLLFLAFPAALAALLRDRVRPFVLWVVLLALALAPTLQIQAASAVADVPLGVFLALAGVAGWRWVEDGDVASLWLGAVFAAAAVGTKVEGAVFVALLAGALAVAAALRGRSLRPAALAAALVVVSALPWELWSRAHDLGNPVADAGGLRAGPAGRIPSGAVSMLRELADPTSWLALIALAVVATVLAARRQTGRTLAAVTAFVTLASLASLLAVYWATPLDFDYHVATSVRRVITAPIVFAAAMTPLLLARAQASR